MASVPYSVKQGDRLTLSNPASIYAIGGDNPTPFYLNFPNLDAGSQWVFPFTYNFMYPTPSPGIVQVNATTTPVGFPTAPVSTLTALLAAYDTAQVYNPGTRVLQSSADRQPGAKFTITQNTQTTITYSIPPGTICLELRVTIVNPGIDATSVRVQGVQSGWDYYPLTQLNRLSTLLIVPVDTAQDQQVNIIANTGTVAGNGSILVTLVRAQETVDFYDRTTRQLGQVDAVPSGTVITAGFDQTIAAGGNAVLIAGATTQSIYCLYWNFYALTVGAAVILLESATTSALIARENTSAVHALSHPLAGKTTVVGEGVRMRNTSGVVSGEMVGELVAIQR